MCDNSTSNRKEPCPCPVHKYRVSDCKKCNGTPQHFSINRHSNSTPCDCLNPYELINSRTMCDLLGLEGVSLNCLYDVNLNDIMTGDTLQWNGEEWIPVTACDLLNDTVISCLGDVHISSAGTGDYLCYDPVAGIWTNSEICFFIEGATSATGEPPEPRLQ